MVGRQLVVSEAPEGLPPDRREPCGVAGGLEGLPELVHLIVGSPGPHEGALSYLEIHILGRGGCLL
jgi:hypothetical protein